MSQPVTNVVRVHNGLSTDPAGNAPTMSKPLSGPLTPRAPDRARLPFEWRQRHLRGRHRDSVVTPAHVAAFVPDHGKPVDLLIADRPEVSTPPTLPSTEGHLLLDRDRLATSFAADRPLAQAEFTSNGHLPVGMTALLGTVVLRWHSPPGRSGPTRPPSRRPAITLSASPARQRPKPLSEAAAVANLT